jgi:hypothetical protein
MLTKPTRSRSNSFSSGCLVAFGIVGLLGVAWLLVSTTLMVTVGIVHSWWPLVPTMPFTVAFILAGIKLLITLVLTVIGEAWKSAIR